MGIILYLFSCNKPYKALVFSVSSIDPKPNVRKKHGYIVICGEPALYYVGTMANGLVIYERDTLGYPTCTKEQEL